MMSNDWISKDECTHLECVVSYDDCGICESCADKRMQIIKFLAKNLAEIDEAANGGEYQTYTAEQWIKKASEAAS